MEPTDDPFRLRRREVLAMMAAAGTVGAGASPGAAMLEDVRAYDAMGEHRTATPADHAASQWLRRRLGAAGLQAELQHFEVPLFVPERRELRLADGVMPVFPAWPVVQTPAAGIVAPLASHDAPSLAGKIAVVSLPRAPGLWEAPGMGEVALEVCRRGPRGVIAITEGPTGEVVAMNAVPTRFDWPVPVVLAGGRDGARLTALAASGAEATLVSTGAFTPKAQAANVVARRPGEGRAIVISTPKSGWFHCAGERATGLAVFLHLADWLSRHSRAELLFVAFAGHELNYHGGAAFMADGAPPADQVRLWMHIGANAAMQPLRVSLGAAAPDPGGSPRRRVTATPAALDAARRAFGPAAGYDTVAEMNEATAVGEPSIIRHAGYPVMAGIIGANPLFHTPLDRADVVTTPAELETVAAAARGFLAGFVAVG
ncbi:MAG TPA: hypothetical protein VGH03_11030 [Caulobacteraceae bacterium]|jgi:hypothetical protein